MTATINFPRDTTLQNLITAINDGNTKLSDGLNSIAAIIGVNGTYDISSISKVQYLVKMGLAEKVIPVGSQIITTWADTSTTTPTQYTAVWDVVHYGKVTLQDGETVNGMYLQWHYATPFGVQFDNYEAFYYATSILPAGTYNVSFGVSWGKNVINNKVYQFTTTQDIPAGGQISGFEMAPDTTTDKWNVKTWRTSSDTTPLETLTLTEGSGGTSLGVLKPGGDGTLNCLQRTSYGYNRWSQSAIRQWLNSANSSTKWWTPQHNFDRFPNELLTKNGFLSGFSSDFLSAIGTVKVTTALNTITDSAIGTQEDTYDKIFLASLQQENIVPQLADVEGETWEYWKRASGRTGYSPVSTAMQNYVTYGIDNKLNAQYVRLRSAYRGFSNSTWFVGASGGVGANSSTAAYRCAPACVIV